MTNRQLGQIWLVLSLFGLYYSLNTWIVTQGGSELFGARLIVDGRRPAALFGLMIGQPVLALAAVVGTVYARRSAGGWHARLPVVGFERIETHSREGRLYQGFMLLVLILLPLVALGHFWRLVLEAPVLVKGLAVRHDIWHFDWALISKFDNSARLCTDFTIPCAESVTFLPWLQPVLLVLLALATVVAVGAQLGAIFGRRHSRPPVWER